MKNNSFTGAIIRWNDIDIDTTITFVHRWILQNGEWWTHASATVVFEFIRRMNQTRGECRNDDEYDRQRNKIKHDACLIWRATGHQSTRERKVKRQSRKRNNCCLFQRTRDSRLTSYTSDSLKRRWKYRREWLIWSIRSLVESGSSPRTELSRSNQIDRRYSLSSVFLLRWNVNRMDARRRCRANREDLFDWFIFSFANISKRNGFLIVSGPRQL